MKLDTNILRYSGYRVRFMQPDQQRIQFPRVVADAEKALSVPISLAKQEPYFIDDAFQGMSIKDLIQHNLSNGEAFACMYGDDFLGFATLYDIFHQRQATMDAWAVPKFRATRPNLQCAKEIIEYAFKPFPEGLGLLKLKANVCIHNLPALRACSALGFEVKGMEQLGALHHGTLYDTLNFELLNARLIQPTAETINREQVESTKGTDLHPASTVSSASILRSSAGSERSDTESADTAGGDEPRGRGGSAITELVATELGPDESSGTESV